LASLLVLGLKAYVGSATVPVTPTTIATPVSIPVVAMAALKRLSVGVSDLESIGPFASWTNVRSDYGAVGDGVADDTAAIRRGLNALCKYNASTGPAVLYFPAGNYRITSTLNMELNTGAKLIGADPTTTTIASEGAANGTMLQTSGSFGMLFTRLTWDGKGTAQIGIAQWWNFLVDRANY
jgi:polygalacturonase